MCAQCIYVKENIVKIVILLIFFLLLNCSILLYFKINIIYSCDGNTII